VSEVVCIQALVDGKFSAQATGWLVRGDRLVTVSTVLVEGAEVVAIAPDGHVPLNLVQRDSASGLVVLQPVDTLDNHLFLDAITAKPHDRWRAPGFPDGSTQRTYIGDVVDPETAGELLELKSDEALGELGGLQGAPVLVTEHVVGVVVRADGNRIWAADATKALDRLGLLADATPPERPPVADSKDTKLGRIRKRLENNILIVAVTLLTTVLMGVATFWDKVTPLYEVLLGLVRPETQLVVRTTADPLLQLGHVVATGGEEPVTLQFDVAGVVEPGVLTVVGYIDDVRVIGNVIELAPGEKAEHTLHPSFRMTGEALDFREHTPLAGVQVRVSGLVTTTRDDGTFTLEGLPMQSTYTVSLWGGALTDQYPEEDPWDGTADNSLWSDSITFTGRVQLE